MGGGGVDGVPARRGRREVAARRQPRRWRCPIPSEVNLNRRLQWNSLGDFMAELPRHRPVARPEAAESGASRGKVQVEGGAGQEQFGEFEGWGSRVEPQKVRKFDRRSGQLSAEAATSRRK